MTEQEIWKYCWDRKVAHTRPFYKDYIWVKVEDLEPIEKYFIKEFNLFHPKSKSLRSRSYFFHIHALYQGEHVFVHREHGNVARFLPLGLIHLFVDVIPFFFLVIIKGVSVKSVITCPKLL